MLPNDRAHLLALAAALMLAGCGNSLSADNPPPETPSATDKTDSDDPDDTQAPADPAEAGDDTHLETVRHSTQQISLPTDGVTLQLPDDEAVISVHVVHDADTLLLTAEDGTTLTGESVEFGDATVLYLVDSPFPTDQLVTLTSEGGTHAAVQYEVAARDDEPTLTAHVDGTRVTVTIDSPAGPAVGVVTAHAGGQQLATDLTLTADTTDVTFDAPASANVEIAAELDGPYRRQLTTTVTTRDATAALGPAERQYVEGGALLVEFPLTTEQDGSHMVTFRVVDDTGELVTAAVGTADPVDGQATVVVYLDRETLQGAVRDGAAELTFADAALVRPQDSFVTVAKFDGTFGTIDLADLES
jgi:hypothetical protein